MQVRTTAGVMVRVLLLGLAVGCNGQKPITFKLNPDTSPHNQPVPDLNLPLPRVSATPSRWEYKVVKAPVGGEQELTRFFNELGRDRWEFAGQLQTTASYVVLRRPRLPRDYTRSRGDLTPPDLPGGSATGRLSTSPDSGRRPALPATAPTVPKDTRPTAPPRLDEKPRG